jgi:drug/metabolite transporter (DMT)-like permease
MIRTRSGGALTSCLVAAALWAISISLFRPLIARFGPQPVNFFKCAFASLAYLSWLAVAGRLGGLGTLDPGAVAQLALSGFVGMAIGDSLLFSAVAAGGIQRTLVIYNSAPLMTALLDWASGGGAPTSRVWAGMLLVAIGVGLVETDPGRPAAGRAGSAAAGAPPDRRALRWTVIAALGAALGQAAGLLLMQGPLRSVPIVEASLVRLAAAGAGVLLLLLSRRGGWASLVRMGPRAWPALALPSLTGTVIAVMFMMQGVRDLPPGIAAALLGTTPLFSLPISRFVLSEPVGPHSYVGTAAAVLGVALFAL